jgi:hypothetical protein
MTDQADMDKYIYEWINRSPEILPFPRHILRKRIPVGSFKEFQSLIHGYDGRTDLFVSLFTDFQMDNNIFDCIFIDMDTYVEVGETLEDLNKRAEAIENFLAKEEIWFRRFFSGRKGLHYYIPFKPVHFSFYSNAIRRWAETMPKVNRVDMQHYWATGEVKTQKTWPYDTKTISNSQQLVRIPYTKHPKTGVYVTECYGRLSLPFNERHELWNSELNDNLLKSLMMRDRPPDTIDRAGASVNFNFDDSPACIIKALRLMPGHPTHDQAWHLCNFMITLEASDSEIQNVFKMDTTRYDSSRAQEQIDSIRRAGLNNMSCDKVKFIGLCDEKQCLRCPMWPSIDRYLFDGDNLTLKSKCDKTEAVKGEDEKCLF